MNFIDKAFEQRLAGDDFLQAMANIYSEPQVRDELNRYPSFVEDIILIIDYDTALQIDGLGAVIFGNLSGNFHRIIAALKRSGLSYEAEILQKAKNIFDISENKFEEMYGELYDQLALNNNNYDEFWDSVREYIDQNLKQ